MEKVWEITNKNIHVLNSLKEFKFADEATGYVENTRFILLPRRSIIMKLVSKLNDKQREDVLATEGYVKVIAGAGSGKTKLLVSRYAYLVKDYGIDSASILCVTFTNKAAAEMKKRIRNLIGEEYDTTLICTYHGFCNRLIRENSEKLFFNKQFQIMDGHHQKAILAEIYKKYELKLDYASFEAIMKKIVRFKRSNEYVPKICNPETCQILEKIENQDDQIIEDFLQRQKATYTLDFTDLICFAIYMLNNFSDVKEKWQERLNYIMVDEFQDSSPIEVELIDILSASFKNLMIVGDPDQNIYEWRGSDVKLLVDFDKNHEPTNTIYLNQNYRSTPEILNCANALIENNKMRLKKDLFTKNAVGDKVYHFHSKNDYDEMDTIIRIIKENVLNKGYSYSDCAILYRSNFLSRIAEKKLLEKNVQYEIYGGVKFYQRMEILDILAYLKLIEYDDDVAFRRIVNKPRRKFGRTKMNYISELKEKNNVSLFDCLESNLDSNIIANSNAKEFVTFIKNIRQKKEKMSIAEIVNEVSEKSGYEKYIRELGDEERLDNLAEFKRIANEFEKDFGEKLTLAEFLQQISLQSNEDINEKKDSVKLMTIHASKGLEFPIVFLIGLNEGIFPSSKTIEERKELGLEEERRLCYVAITRAKKQLYLMDSEGFSINGNKKVCSRFLFEIGEENYERIGKISDDVLLESKKIINKNLTIENMEVKSDKKIGTAVEHHIFGRGIITSINEKNGNYGIKFDKLERVRNISKEYFGKEYENRIENINFASEAMSNNKILEKESFEQKTISNSYQSIKSSSSNSINTTNNIPDNKEKNKSVLMAGHGNLWKDSIVPKSGWSCVGVEDLESPSHICEMCGHHNIRYAHHMVHPNYRPLICGCVCAGRMEGNIERAKSREAELKKKNRRLNAHSRNSNNLPDSSYKTTRKEENEYSYINGIRVGIHQNGYGIWKYSLNGELCLQNYQSKENAIIGALEAMMEIKE